MATTNPTLTAAINPRVRKSPFFDATVKDGLAAVTSYNHMWLPSSYGDPEAEYRRLTEGVSMWDVAAQRHIEVSGAQADELVQLVTAVDVTGVEPGRGVYAPMVDFGGTLINDPVLLRFEDGTWRFSISDSDARLWIEGVRGARSFDAQVRELETASLAVQGPKADGVLRELGCEWAEGLEYFERRTTRIGDASVILSRSGWSSQGGYELFLDDPAAALDLWQSVREAGAAFVIGPGAPNQPERIESVLLSYGTDTGFDSNPIEVGLEDHLDLDGPHFIGQEALLSIREQGPERQLLGVVASGDPIETFGHPVPVEVGGRVVGKLRAAAWSPKFSRNLGLALVEASCQVGAEGTTQAPEDRRTVTFVDLPFQDVL